MASTFLKFDNFSQDLAHGVHNLKLPASGGHTLKIALTNTAPTTTNTSYTTHIQPNELATGNNYTQGGSGAVITGSSQTSGTYRLIVNDVSWTATPSAWSTFRYAVLYNDTASGKPLIGWWDYGVGGVTLQANETFTVDFDPANGVFTLA
jgi:hypothetical protein